MMATLKGMPLYKNAVVRPEKLEFIRTTLRELALTKGPSLRALVLHGMAGSGKTCLASQVVQSLSQEYFENGIIWESMEHLRNSSPEKRKEELRKLMTSTCLDASDRPTAQQEQKLLVLDSVWHSDILHVFRGTAIVLMVTTRNAAIAKNLSENSAIKRIMDVTKCSINEAKQITGYYFVGQPYYLMNEISKKCGGIAQAYKLIAKDMEKLSTLEGRTNLEVFCIRMKDLLKVKMKWEGIQYETYFDSLYASIESLETENFDEYGLEDSKLSSKEIKEHYLHLAVIKLDEELFASKLVSLWRTVTKETAERLLNWFADRSLLERTKREKTYSNDNEEIFKFHPVQHDCLKIHAKTKKIMINNRTIEFLNDKLLEGNAAAIIISPPSNASAADMSSYHRHNKKLAHIIRTIEYGGRWDHCFHSVGVLFEDSAKLEEFQNALIKQNVIQRDETHGWTLLHEAALRGKLPRMLIALD